MGGDPSIGGIMDCPGPCDMTALQPGFPPITSPDNPAASYSRGQTVTIKYQRNNHGPGGFVRHTLVPVNKMMDKAVHAKNAFQYSCWGADPVPAKKSELGRDRNGFSLVGGDGKLHDMPISYYTTNITIPDVIPDGVYVLGWVWFGGLGGSINHNVPDDPHPFGLFSDYWSCSFVQIKGGNALAQEYAPVFENNMKQFWKDGCMSANDAPGICVYEPCKDVAMIQYPKSFKNGRIPDALTPENFGKIEGARSQSRGTPVLPTPVPRMNTLKDALEELYKCRTFTRSKKHV